MNFETKQIVIIKRALFQIRFYSRNSNLDNNYSKISKVAASILQMNIFKNLLVLFGSDCRIQVFGLEGGKDSSKIFNFLKIPNLCVNFIQTCIFQLQRSS
jgi:hypothetical protein